MHWHSLTCLPLCAAAAAIRPRAMQVYCRQGSHCLPPPTVLAQPLALPSVPASHCIAQESASAQGPKGNNYNSNGHLVRHHYCANVVGGRASVWWSGKGAADVASIAPRDEGRSCCCRPFWSSKEVHARRNKPMKKFRARYPCGHPKLFRANVHRKSFGHALKTVTK